MSWADLETDYFVPVCREAFDGYFKAHGFSMRESEATRVTYGRERCWLDIHHYVEESPRFSPMLTLHLEAARASWPSRLADIFGLSSAPEVPRGFDGVGLWYVIPGEVPESEYSTWYFSSASELEQTVPRLRDEVVDRWARPLWDDPARLSDVIKKRYADYLEERRQERLPPDPRKGFAILREREQEIRSRCNR